MILDTPRDLATEYVSVDGESSAPRYARLLCDQHQQAAEHTQLGLQRTVCVTEFE